MYSFWLCRFWKSAWNIFDVVVVTIGLMNYVLPDLPGPLGSQNSSVVWKKNMSFGFVTTWVYCHLCCLLYLLNPQVSFLPTNELLWWQKYL